MPPIYSESLYQALSKTGMFKQVIIRSEARTYDVVARVSEEVYGTPTIPVVAILTLGIIPSIVPERVGLRFSLENVAASSSMKVDATYSSEAYLGWITLPMMLFPSYSCGDPRSSRRYLDFLKFRISETSESVLRGFRK